MANVLVTGGSGFIGGFLVERLEKDGHNVTILDVKPPIDIPDFKGNYFCGDVRDRDTVLGLVYKNDIVFHLAGVLGTHETMETPWETADINIGGAVRVFEAVKKCNKKCVYITLGNEWENPYTITKMASARFALMYHREFGTKIQVIKGLNVYGGRQHWYPIQKCVPMFITNALTNEDLPVFGDGQQIIDLVYIDDTVEALIRASESDIGMGEVIDAGTGIPITVNDFAQIVLELTGSDAEIRYLPMRRGEPIRSVTLGTGVKVKEYFGFTPKTDLKTGLLKTVNWYAEALKRGWR